MTKDSLVAFIAEKARISIQRAELAYEAFWEAILSELKTGHFSLPVGKGTLQVKDKTPAPFRKEVKTEKKTVRKASEKSGKAKKSATPKSKKTVVKRLSKGKKKR